MKRREGEYSQHIEVICAKPIKKIVFPNGILPLMHITQDDGKTYTYKYFLLNEKKP